MKRIRIQRTNSPYRRAARTLRGLKGLCSLFTGPLVRSRQENLQQAKIAKLQQDREIGETIAGIKANQLVLLDIQIEAKKLELATLRRKLGNPDDFADQL